MNSTTRKYVLALIVCCSSAALVRADDIQYNRDIRPILTDACFKCHGPAAKKGGFRLDVREDATAPAKSKKAPIVAGKSAESELIKRIFSDDADEIMPPPTSHRPLTKSEKELIKKWIAEGAKYQKHWSFEPPAKVAPPKVSAKHPIDAFILDRLKREMASLLIVNLRNIYRPNEIARHDFA